MTLVHSFADIALAVIVGLTVGVIFSQKIKDKLAGVPATVRSDVAAYEAAAVAKVKAKL